MRPDDLPIELDQRQRVLLADLARLWPRLTDWRFGQLLQTACGRPARHPADLTEDTIRQGLEAALGSFPERPPPTGPYSNTETRGQGNFIRGRPRDPARIPRLLEAFARAWASHPDLTLGQLLDYALDCAGIPENEFCTRWLLIEDAPLKRALEAITSESLTRDGDP